MKHRVYLETVEEVSVSLSLPMIMWSSKLSCLKEESSTFGTFHFLTIVKNQQHDDNNDIIESVEGKTITDDHDTLGEHSDGVDHTTDDDDDDVGFSNTNNQLTTDERTNSGLVPEPESTQYFNHNCIGVELFESKLSSKCLILQFWSFTLKSMF